MAILTPKTFTSGEVLTAADVNAYLRGGYMGSVYFTSSGTFTKATYPWLRAVRVRLVGAGGGSGSTTATLNATGDSSTAGGGGGGAYAESFITDIASLASSVTVTVGTGVSQSAGGSSSFGSGEAYEVSAEGGSAGEVGVSLTTPFTRRGGDRGVTGTGDLVIPGQSGGNGVILVAASQGYGGLGGASHLSGTPIQKVNGNLNGDDGENYGGGATSPLSITQSGARTSGTTGGDGIVIVELYA